MKSQVLHTVWCYISGEASGEIWNWSLLSFWAIVPYLRYCVAEVTFHPYWARRSVWKQIEARNPDRAQCTYQKHRGFWFTDVNRKSLFCYWSQCACVDVFDKSRKWEGAVGRSCRLAPNSINTMFCYSVRSLDVPIWFGRTWSSVWVTSRLATGHSLVWKLKRNSLKKQQESPRMPRRLKCL